MKSKNVLLLTLFALIFFMYNVNCVYAWDGTYIDEYGTLNETIEMTKNHLHTTSHNAYALDTGGATWEWYVGANATLLPLNHATYDMETGLIFHYMPSMTIINFAFIDIMMASSYEYPDPVTVTIYGIAEDDPALFTTLSDFQNRPKTTASVTYTFSGTYDMYDQVQIDVSSIVTELIDDYDLDGTENAGFIISTTKSWGITRDTFSWGASPEYAPDIYINAYCNQTFSIPEWVWDYPNGTWILYFEDWTNYTADIYPWGIERSWDGTDGVGAGSRGSVKSTANPSVYHYAYSYTWSIPSVYGTQLFRQFNTTFIDWFGASGTSALGEINKGGFYNMKLGNTYITKPKANVLGWSRYEGSKAFSFTGLTTLAVGVGDTDGINYMKGDDFIFGFHMSESDWLNPDNYTYTSKEARLFVNDGGQGWENQVYILELGSGVTIAPRYITYGLNTTVSGDPNSGFCQWEDITGLDTSIFSTNITGTWLNYTNPLTGLLNTSNDAFSTYENTSIIFYQFYANNSVGNWNTTGLLSTIMLHFDIEEQSDYYGIYDSNENQFDNWLFRNEYYDLKLSFWNPDYLIINFTDGNSIIEFTWDNSTGIMDVEGSNAFVIGEMGTSYENDSSGLYNFTWSFTPITNIVDAQNITMFYYVEAFEDLSSASGYLNFSFNIYNLGGLTYYEFGGDGTRSEGGREFDLSATNGTNGDYAYSYQIYRKLQHYHTLVELDMGNDWNIGTNSFDFYHAKGYVEYGFDYRYNNSWYPAIYVRIYTQDAEVGNYGLGYDQDWVEWVIDWYRYNASLGVDYNFNTDYILSNHYGYSNTSTVPYTNRTSTQFFIDIWFDRLNSSTTVAGSISPYYYGMYEEVGAWWFGYGDFIPITDFTPAKALTDLYFNDTILNSINVDLVRVWCSVNKSAFASSDDNEYSLLHTETNRLTASDRMQGIDEPTLQLPKTIDMPSTSFLAPLIRAVNGIKDMIVQSIINIITSMWGIVDTLFSIMGLETWWNVIKSYITTFSDLVISIISEVSLAITNIVTLISYMFQLIGEGIGRFFNLLGGFVVGLISWWRAIIGIFTGTSEGFSNIWESWGMSDWINLFVTLSPIYWFQRIASSDNAIDTAKSDVIFFSWIFTGLFTLFSQLIQLALSLIRFIIELLPI